LYLLTYTTTTQHTTAMPRQQ